MSLITGYPLLQKAYLEFFTSEENITALSETVQTFPGITFQAVNRHNPDVMKDYASCAMPIAFLAMHEEKNPEREEVLEVWEEVWQEGTPGSEGGIRLYLSELMELLPQALDSAQWSVKAQAARYINVKSF